MLTVLPTPAPPNSPTLPPFANGQHRSITLIPVSSNSDAGLKSVNFGASRWMLHLSSVLISPNSSMGSPSTFMMRPNVASPTGTEIGASVLSTSRPRLNPSVDPSAIVLTTPSPICCCTSSVVLALSPFTSKASYILGIDSLGNFTSTTAPMICMMFPELIFLVPL